MLQSTERRSGDDLALLCVHTLLDVFVATGACALLSGEGYFIHSS